MSSGPALDSVRSAAFERLRESLGELLGAERRLRGRDHKRHDGLTYAQVRALAALGRGQEMTAGQLAKQADLNPASVTAMVDQLEAAGVIQRRRSTEDRRVCNVSLTARGWELLEQKRERWYALWDERCADLSEQELEIAAKVMTHIADMFDAV